MLSLGIFSFLAARIAVRRRGLESGSPPPTRAAMVISRITFVKMRPRLASVAAFLCLMVAHFECPDMIIASWGTSWGTNPGLLPRQFSIGLSDSEQQGDPGARQFSVIPFPGTYRAA